MSSKRDLFHRPSLLNFKSETTMPKNDQDQDSIPPPKTEEKIDRALLEARRIFLSDAVDSNTAADIIKKLWYLELTAPGKPILFVINSPGGSVDSGFAIWDQIKMISSPVTTLVTGLAASMGSVLSLAGAPKRRFATPNSRFMIHQPLIGGVIKGQATDLEIQAKEMLKTRNTLIELYMRETGKDFAAIEKAIDRDTWMSAQEAYEFGLLSGVVESYKDLS
ncbi:ATP-dependent Clp protease proteolytic subunit 1 [Parachlamydia acanthamoebae UV-7]|uniref:ATP-dependent Clp protease proteolytic subunit n=3 Tax=Parachlamydia acanthamoebae TaxID=83552 RepID=F8KV31_PARAV|nr:ATP-dependent Clp protease proteolytic subunit 1 [Parachlamydia acanthamoebae UV-7]